MKQIGQFVNFEIDLGKLKQIGQFVNFEIDLGKLKQIGQFVNFEIDLGKLKQIGQFVNFEIDLGKLKQIGQFVNFEIDLGKLKQIGEMNSEIEKRTNCENGRRPSFISSVLSDWFNQPLARSLIGWNLRRCSWLKLFFWDRRKQ